jgi:XFP N-terminal domain
MTVAAQPALPHEQPLRPEHIKPRLLGHWGTTPGLNFLWARRELKDLRPKLGPKSHPPAVNARTESPARSGGWPLLRDGSPFDAGSKEGGHRCEHVRRGICPGLPGWRVG